MSSPDMQNSVTGCMPDIICKLPRSHNHKLNTTEKHLTTYTRIQTNLNFTMFFNKTLLGYQAYSE